MRQASLASCLAANFKMAVNGTAPQYLSEMCIPASTMTALRCNRLASRGDLVFLPVTHLQTNAYDRHGFQYAAPKVWNSLPVDSRQAPSLMTFRNRLDLFISRSLRAVINTTFIIVTLLYCQISLLMCSEILWRALYKSHYNDNNVYNNNKLIISNLKLIQN